MTVTPVATRTLTAGEDLGDFVVAHLPEVADRSVVVVASKALTFAERANGSLAFTEVKCP